MQSNIQYEKEIDLAKQYKSSIPVWAWIGGIVFLLLIWIFAISIEQANITQHYVKQPGILILSYFSYNLVLASIFLSMLGSFFAIIIIILGRTLLIASLFFSFLFLLLIMPFIIPFFIQTSLYIAPQLTYKHNLIEESQIYEKKIRLEILMKNQISESSKENNQNEESIKENNNNLTTTQQYESKIRLDTIIENDKLIK